MTSFIIQLISALLFLLQGHGDQIWLYAMVLLQLVFVYCAILSFISTFILVSFWTSIAIIIAIIIPLLIFFVYIFSPIVCLYFFPYFFVGLANCGIYSFNSITDLFTIVHKIVDKGFEQEQQLQVTKVIENICRQLSTWLSQYIAGSQYLKHQFKGVEQQDFWEIVLISAGDVEQNPGPTFMSGNYT
jgi:hypothetical protein